MESGCQATLTGAVLVMKGTCNHQEVVQITRHGKLRIAMPVHVYTRRGRNDVSSTVGNTDGK